MRAPYRLLCSYLVCVVSCAPVARVPRPEPVRDEQAPVGMASSPPAHRTSWDDLSPNLSDPAPYDIPSSPPPALPSSPSPAPSPVPPEPSMESFAPPFADLRSPLEPDNPEEPSLESSVLEPFDTRWDPMPSWMPDERLPGRPPPGERPAGNPDRQRNGWESGEGAAGADPAGMTGPGEAGQISTEGGRRDAAETTAKATADLKRGAAGAGATGIDSKAVDSKTESSAAALVLSRPTAGWPVASRLAWAWKAYYDHAVDAALEEFLELRRLAPDRAAVRLGAGRCFLARGELADARSWFAQAVELDPADPEARFFLGLVAYQDEDFQEAISVWELALPYLELRPPGPLHRDHAWLLARAYLEVGSLDAGRRWFDRALAIGGRGPGGVLYPPAIELEYTARGRLPADRFMPVGGRLDRVLGDGLLFSAEGAIWKLWGTSVLRERVSHPPAGWRDSHPSPRPDGQEIALISTDAQGRCWLMSQSLDGARRLLVDFPVAPVRPAWSRDARVLAFVALAGPDDAPRIHLLQHSTRDVRLGDWPSGPSSDPAFTTDNALLLVYQVDGRFVLGRTLLGEQRGDELRGRLKPLTPEVSRDEEALKRLERRIAARAAKERKASRPPLHVADPWRAPLGRLEPGEPGQATPKEAASGALVATGAYSVSPPRPGVTPENKDAPVRTAETPPMDRRRRPPPTSGPSSEPRGIPMLPGEGDVGHPAAQPRDDALAFDRRMHGLRRIWVRESGGYERAVSPAELDCFAPAFSPDGRSLAYICIEEGVGRLYLHDLDRKEARPLYAEGLSANMPVWLEPPVRPAQVER